MPRINEHISTSYISSMYMIKNSCPPHGQSQRNEKRQLTARFHSLKHDVFPLCDYIPPIISDSSIVLNILSLSSVVNPILGIQISAAQKKPPDHERLIIFDYISITTKPQPHAPPPSSE